MIHRLAWNAVENEALVPWPQSMQPSLRTIYSGTYTEGTKSRGIYAFRLHSDGSLKSLGCVARAVNPTFLCLDPDRQMIYAVEETLGGSSREGAILAYAVDRSSGDLELVSRLGSGGVGPCFLASAKTAGSLLFANYHDGSIGSIRLTGEGNLASRLSLVTLSGSSIHPQRQTCSHPHAIVTCFGGRYAIVADLGSDRLHVFGLSPDGEISDAPIMTRAVPPGSGPRHLVIHPSGRRFRSSRPPHHPEWRPLTRRTSSSTIQVVSSIRALVGPATYAALRLTQRAANSLSK